MQACFIGHRKIEKKEELTLSLKEIVVSLINKGVTTFLFGSMSEFDTLSLKVVSELKKEYPFIKRVYVRSAYQNVSKSYQEYLLKFYEQTYFPPKIEKAGKYSYVERNYEMIDNSTYCVFYYNENYAPQANGKLKQDKILMRKSGTKTAYNYAVRKKKEIINLYK
ncbi:MAG: DUF1273 domain-containing protein [Clostridiales bacterium]|nr:DUF1273 domain-containing protein [Clostridiales bacterium]